MSEEPTIEWRIRYPTTGNVFALGGMLDEESARKAAEDARAQGLVAVVERREVGAWEAA